MSSTPIAGVRVSAPEVRPYSPPTMTPAQHAALVHRYGAKAVATFDAAVRRGEVSTTQFDDAVRVGTHPAQSFTRIAVGGVGALAAGTTLASFLAERGPLAQRATRSLTTAAGTLAVGATALAGYGAYEGLRAAGVDPGLSALGAGGALAGVGLGSWGVANRLRPGWASATAAQTRALPRTARFVASHVAGSSALSGVALAGLVTGAAASSFAAAPLRSLGVPGGAAFALGGVGTFAAGAGTIALLAKRASHDGTPFRAGVFAAGAAAVGGAIPAALYLGTVANHAAGSLDRRQQLLLGASGVGATALAARFAFKRSGAASALGAATAALAGVSSLMLLRPNAHHQA